MKGVCVCLCVRACVCMCVEIMMAHFQIVFTRQPFNAKALSQINTYLMELTAMETSIPGHHEIQSSFRRLQNQIQNF